MISDLDLSFATSFRRRPFIFLLSQTFLEVKPILIDFREVIATPHVLKLRVRLLNRQV